MVLEPWEVTFPKCTVVKELRDGFDGVIAMTRDGQALQCEVGKSPYAVAGSESLPENFILDDITRMEAHYFRFSSSYYTREDLENENNNLYLFVRYTFEIYICRAINQPNKPASRLVLGNSPQSCFPVILVLEVKQDVVF